VSEPITDEEVLTLVGEGDPFKLAILGLSAMEDAIEEVLGNLLPHGLPTELKNARFPIKLSVAIASGVLPQEYERGFLAFNTLRNKFAHGEIRSLTRQGANNLADAFDPLFLKEGEEPPSEMRDGLRNSEPIWTLRFAVLSGMAAIKGGAAAWLQRRNEEQGLLRSLRAQEMRTRQEAARTALRTVQERAARRAQSSNQDTMRDD
jgi:hypothetical protein